MGAINGKLGNEKMAWSGGLVSRGLVICYAMTYLQISTLGKNHNVNVGGHQEECKASLPDKGIYCGQGGYFQ